MRMIETIARAICQADEQNGGAPWDWYGTDKARSGYFDSARAVLAAMSEPSDAMVARSPQSTGGYRAMIQAALDE